MKRTLTLENEIYSITLIGDSKLIGILMDKQYFKKQSFEEADNQKEYWKSKSVEERLATAAEMTKAAYGLIGQPFKGMDKTYFTTRKRNG